LTLRQYLGNQVQQHISTAFDTVPRALFTTFSCSFGNCIDIEGVSIFHHVEIVYGYWYTGLYAVFTFTVTIGLFNVISAIFVEVTLAAATQIQADAKHERLSDTQLWARNITMLVNRLVYIAQTHEEYRDKLPFALRDVEGGKLSAIVDDVYELELPADIIELMGKDPHAAAALDALDIDKQDHERLSDILDPDNGGTFSIIELVDGLRRLRGEPRRSDIIKVDLMIRSTQVSVQKMATEFGCMHRFMNSLEYQQNRAESSTGEKSEFYEHET